MSATCVRLEPAAVPELDHHLVAAEALLGPLQVLERGLLADDVRRELHQDPAQLAGLAQGLERRAEAGEHLAAQLARRVVDAAAVVHLRLGPQIGGELLGAHGMARHHPERLHVEHESGRRAPRPRRRRVRARKRVVAGVQLDRVELLGVVVQAGLGRAHRGRIPRLRQRLVGPRARADAERRRSENEASGGSSGRPDATHCCSPPARLRAS